MVTPISANLASNGTGRDGYIVCETTYKYGSQHKPKAANWNKSLRNYAKEFGEGALPKSKLRYPPSQRPQQRCPEAPGGFVGGIEGELSRFTPRSARSAWVPMGGAPRKAIPRSAAPSPSQLQPPMSARERYSGGDERQDLKPKSFGGPGPLPMEVGRAIMLEETPRAVSCEPTRPRGAAFHRPQLMGLAPTAYRVECRGLESATAMRAAERAAYRKPVEPGGSRCFTPLPNMEREPVPLRPNSVAW